MARPLLWEPKWAPRREISIIPGVEEWFEYVPNRSTDTRVRAKGDALALTRERGSRLVLAPRK